MPPSAWHAPLLSQLSQFLCFPIHKCQILSSLPWKIWWRFSLVLLQSCISIYLFISLLACLWDLCGQGLYFHFSSTNIFCVLILCHDCTRHRNRPYTLLSKSLQFSNTHLYYSCSLHFLAYCRLFNYIWWISEWITQWMNKLRDKYELLFSYLKQTKKKAFWQWLMVSVAFIHDFLRL